VVPTGRAMPSRSHRFLGARELWSPVTCPREGSDAQDLAVYTDHSEDLWALIGKRDLSLPTPSLRFGRWVLILVRRRLGGIDEVAQVLLDSRHSLLVFGGPCLLVQTYQVERMPFSLLVLLRCKTDDLLRVLIVAASDKAPQA
jgi:hypothetical protein